MIKKDIAEDIYQDHGGFTRVESERYTDLILKLIQEGLDEEGSVTIAGFGKFHFKQKPIRSVTMPNGRKTMTQGGRRVQFLPSPGFKARINGVLATQTPPGDEPSAPTPGATDRLPGHEPED